jgi:hypothetical protein
MNYAIVWILFNVFNVDILCNGHLHNYSLKYFKLLFKFSLDTYNDELDRGCVNEAGILYDID